VTFEFVIADFGPESGSWIGVVALEEAWRAILAPWDEYRPTTHSFRELDDERILVIGGAVARGKRSGVEVRAEGADLFHLRGGRVTRLVIYFDLQNALADLGLEE